MTQDNSIDTVEVNKNYHESGVLWLETPYVNRVKHGIEKEYSDTGVLM